MSGQHEESHDGISFGALLGGLLGISPGIIGLIVILAGHAGIGPQAKHDEASSDSAAVAERIKPVADVVVAAAPAAPGAEKSGEEVVKSICSACHAVGALGAPKIGDKAAWGPRIAQGYETLVKHAIEGIRSMPARGGNPALTDGEVAAAVAHMANQAGANFKAGK
jgi:cytochrome c5